MMGFTRPARIAAVCTLAACGDPGPGAGEARESGDDDATTSGVADESGSGTSGDEGPAPPPPAEACDDTPEVAEECATLPSASGSPPDECGQKYDDLTAIPVCADAVSGLQTLGLRGTVACACPVPGVLHAQDFDGDGAAELVATCESPHRVVLWRGRVDGKIDCPALLAVSTVATALWVRDVDDDGLDDLLTLGGATPFVSYLRATSPLEFAPQVLLPVTGPVAAFADPSQQVQFDLDGDGRSEVVAIVQAEDDASSIASWTATGDAVIVESDAIAAPVPEYLRTADVDGDGLLDLVAWASSPGSSWWALGSDEGLGSVTSFNATLVVRRPHFGDVDGDGFADAVGAIEGGSAAVQRGLGDGSFEPTVVVADPSAPENGTGSVLFVRDLDDDGDGDLLFAFGGPPGNGWNLWLSTQDGLRFDTHVRQFEANRFAVGDFDGDGHTDLAATTGITADSIGHVIFWSASP